MAGRARKSSFPARPRRTALHRGLLGPGPSSELGASLLQGWLPLFDVAPRPELIRLIQALDAQGHLLCSVRPVARRYAYLTTIAPPTDVDRMPAPHLGPTRVTEVAEKRLSSFS